MMACALGLVALLGGVGAVHAAAQGRTSVELRATGMVGEKADGYLEVVAAASPALRAEVRGINIKRRAYYTQLAGSRRVKVEEVAAATACEIFALRILPGQYYQLPDGVWRRRQGNQPVPRPDWCA